MKLKKWQRSRVGNGPWQCSSPDRIAKVRARSKVGNVPVAMFLRLNAFLIKQSCRLGKNRLSILETGKDRVICLTSNKYGVVRDLNESVWSSPLVGYNKKQNRRVVDLVGRNTGGSCYQKLRSYYQITARPCHPEEEQQ